jgi:hypothetical protein
MRLQMKHTQKYKFLLICNAVMLIIFINQPVSGQSDSNKTRFGRHIISIHETSDFNFSQYGYARKGIMYGYKFAYYGNIYNTLRGFYSYSVGLNYQYCTNRSVGLNCGFYYSKQGFVVGGGSNNATVGDTTYSRFNYYVSYFYFPIGIKISFLNKYKIRPYLSFDLLNAFLTKEKADIFLAHHEHLILNSNVVRYYFLKPQITVGCDFYIKNKFRVGVEMVWKGYAIYHTNKTFPEKFKYTNLNFGVSFGYVLK